MCSSKPSYSPLLLGAVSLLLRFLELLESILFLCRSYGLVKICHADSKTLPVVIKQVKTES